MNTINFKKKSLMKNFKKALKAANHIQPGDMVRTSNGGNHKMMFPRNSKVTNFINLIINELIETPIIHNNFSRKFLEENILYVLEDLQLNNALNLKNNDFEKQFYLSISTFENKIKDIINKDFEEFECIFHVDNLKLSKPINLGKVTFFPFSEKNSRYSKINDKIMDPNFFKKDEVYVKIKIYGSKQYALTQSQVEIKIAINLLKILLPEQYCNFNLEGDTLIPSPRHHIILNSDEQIFGGWENQNIHFGCNFNNEVGDVDYELSVLSILFNTNPKSDFENRLLTAIYWFSEALSLKRNSYSKTEKKHLTQLNNLEFYDVYPKLLNLVICLETLFVFGDEKKSEAISNKVSLMIAKPGFEEKIAHFLNKIYDYRSKVVHSGNIYVSKHDLNLLIDYTRIALFNTISINYKYSEQIRYLNKLNCK